MTSFSLLDVNGVKNIMHISVTRRQYKDNDVVSTSTFHWIKDQEGVFAWSEVGNYGVYDESLGQEVIIAYQGKHRELELVKTMQPDQVFVDVILTDNTSHDRHYFNEDGYDEFIASANLDISLDHTTTTKVFWMRCHDLLEQLLAERDNFLEKLNICHQVYETEAFPGFGFEVVKPITAPQQEVATIDAEVIETETSIILKGLTIDENGIIHDQSGQPLDGEWTNGPFLSSVRVAPEGVTPPDDGSSNNPPVDASSDDGQTEDGVPVWIAAACKYEIENFVDNEVKDEEEKAITVGGEDNTQNKGNDELH